MLGDSRHEPPCSWPAAKRVEPGPAPKSKQTRSMCLPWQDNGLRCRRCRWVKVTSAGALGYLCQKCLYGQATRARICCSFEREHGADDDLGPARGMVWAGSDAAAGADGSTAARGVKVRAPRSGFSTTTRHDWRVKALCHLRRAIESNPVPVETVDKRRQRHTCLRGASPDVRIDRDPVRVVEGAA